MTATEYTERQKAEYFEHGWNQLLHRAWRRLGPVHPLSQRLSERFLRAGRRAGWARAAEKASSPNRTVEELTLMAATMSNVLNQSTGLTEKFAVAPDSPLWLIAAERVRQRNVEGWTPEHDDAHTDGELARAAATYAMPDWLRNLHMRHICSEAVFTLRAKIWPWEYQWWKPCDRKCEIIKACSLLLAEYERISRAEALATKG